MTVCDMYLAYFSTISYTLPIVTTFQTHCGLTVLCKALGSWLLALAVALAGLVLLLHYSQYSPNRIFPNFKALV